MPYINMCTQYGRDKCLAKQKLVRNCPSASTSALKTRVIQRAQRKTTSECRSVWLLRHSNVFCWLGQYYLLMAFRYVAPNRHGNGWQSNFYRFRFGSRADTSPTQEDNAFVAFLLTEYNRAYVTSCMYNSTIDSKWLQRITKPLI